MASFAEGLVDSIFTPGPTPALLIATNATFAALQVLLLILFVVTYSVHFAFLSVVCGGLWYSINWFATEVRAEQARMEQEKLLEEKNKMQHPNSDTGTEAEILASQAPAKPSTGREVPISAADSMTSSLRQRNNPGDGSEYTSTDSEWEKVSEGEGG